MNEKGFVFRMVNGLRADGTQVVLKAHIEHSGGVLKVLSLETLRDVPLEHITQTEYRLPDGTSITVDLGPASGTS